MTITRVLHCTEALGGGVVTSLSRLVQRQLEAGLDVTVLYSRRTSTPSILELSSVYFPGAALVEIASRRSSVLTLLSLARRLLKVASGGQFDVIHLHSSFAGVMGRVILWIRMPSRRVFYSPHGFSFLRSDLPLWIRSLYRSIELVLAHCYGQIVLVSDSEAEVATECLRVSNPPVLRNGVNVKALPHRMSRMSRSEKRLRVIMVGRITYQKAPWVFSEVAKALSGDAEFVWFGDGELADVERWIDPRFVTVTGWMDHADLLKEISTCDIVLFPSLWEGMPIALMECQAMGLPAVARDVTGNRDIVRHGKTGFLCSDDIEIVSRVRQLIEDESLLEILSSRAVEICRVELSDSELGVESERIYSQRVLGSRD